MSRLVNRRVLTLIFAVFFVIAQTFYWIGIFTRKPPQEKLPGDNITHFVPPFVSILNDYTVAAKYKLLGCNIRKSMSQLSYNILCYLNNTELFVEKNQKFSDTWSHERTSCPWISSDTFNPLFRDGSLNKEDFTKFAFIRDPEDRFVSFFVDKCLKENFCEGCKDVRCASKMIYEKLMKLAKNPNSFSQNDESLWFEWHTAPQTWNCDFRKSLRDFHLIPIGTSRRDRKEALMKLRKVLEIAKVEREHIEKIMKDSLVSNTEHGTHNSNMRRKIIKQVRSDPYVRHYLHRIYYFDYVTFGFDLPAFFSA